MKSQSPNKMKGLVVISAGAEVQRFLMSGAFALVQSEYDLLYVFPDLQSSMRINLDLERLNIPRIQYIPFHQGRYEKWEELFDVSCFAYKEASQSFGVRFEMQAHLGGLAKLDFSVRDFFDVRKVRKIMIHLLGQILRIKNRVKFAKYRKLASKERYKEYRGHVIDSLGLHPEMDKLVREFRPDFIILPSSLLDAMTNDVLQIAEKYNIPTFLLESGWDNISSKGILFHLPTTMAVWGEQTKRHAIDIQGVPAEHVFCLGSPHYEALKQPISAERRIIRQKLGLPVDKRLVLFGGAVRKFDETGLLVEMEKAIGSGDIPPVHILYRPHPWRASRDEVNFFDYDWEFVSMDPEIAQIYRETKENRRYFGGNEFSFSMSYLNELYRIVDAVISPMSTLILESMIIGNPVLAIAFNDGKHLWSADQTAKMTHMKELQSILGIIFCRTREEFVPLLERLITFSGDEELRAGLRQSANYFVVQDDTTYSERLYRLVKERLQEPNKE